jgi:putative DNA primase/helicase
VAAAAAFTATCKRILRDRYGLPDPVEATSGNGTLLLYRIDLPNDDESRDLIKDVLASINHQAQQVPVPEGTPQVKVDESMFNAARIVRLIGTQNAKGHSTPDQPHRPSRLLAVPDPIVTVTLEQLRAVAADAPKPAPKGSTRQRPGGNDNGRPLSRLDVEKWLQARGVGYSVKGAKDGLGRTVYLLDECPFDSSHGGHTETCLMQADDGQLSAKCFHDSCQGKGWQDFKEKIGAPDPDHYDPPLGSRRKGAGRRKPKGPQPLQQDGPRLTDMGNGERMATKHRGDLLYCFPLKTWFTWDGTRYQRDETGEAEKRAKDTVRSIYLEAAAAGDPDQWSALAGHAIASEDARRIGAMLQMARSEDGIPVKPSQLDVDPFLLNVINGTIDLRTGRLREHRREDLITKLAPVTYDPNATCPLWNKFIDKIMALNADLIGYLQRVVGYSLTGNVNEHCVWIFHGDGANDKSTFLGTVRDLLGDYGMQATPELLLVRHNEGHPTERFDLFGKRFVASVEVDDGRRLAEAILKQLSGGESIRARPVFRDNIEFDATHKIVLAVNYKPIIRGTDKGIWRRIKLVPFTVTISEAEKDKDLKDKLKAELPGILNWFLRGCQDWREYGLMEPEEVTRATDLYRRDQDIVQRFLDEQCTLDPQATVEAGSLFAEYRIWSDDVLMTRAKFKEHMQNRGFEQKRERDAIRWYGIRLNSGY